MKTKSKKNKAKDNFRRVIIRHDTKFSVKERNQIDKEAKKLLRECKFKRRIDKKEKKCVYTCKICGIKTTIESDSKIMVDKARENKLCGIRFCRKLRDKKLRIRTKLVKNGFRCKLKFKCVDCKEKIKESCKYLRKVRLARIRLQELRVIKIKFRKELEPLKKDFKCLFKFKCGYGNCSENIKESCKYFKDVKKLEKTLFVKK